MKKLHTLVLACVGLISISSYPTAYAGNKAGDITVTVGGGYEYFASKRRLENAGIGLFALGYDFTDHWGIEAMFAGLNTNFNRSTHVYKQVNGRLYAVDGIYHFSPFSARILFQGIEPYVLAGVGATSLSPNRYDANDEGNINAGVGVQFFANEIVAFRVEARDFYTWVGGKNDVVLDAGVTFAFNCI